MVRVERDAEIAVLHSSLGDCVAGVGGAVVVSGPVGVGKTELLRAIARDAAERGVGYLHAAGSQAERSLPMGVLGQIFAKADLPDDVAARVRRLLESGALTAGLYDREDESAQQVVAPVLHGLTSILLGLSEREPIVIAIDDAHEADVASLQCLRYLIRRIDRARILVVLSDTTTMRPTRPRFWAELLSQPHCQLIRVNLLSPVGVAAVLREAVVDADEHTPSLLYQMSGGNPLLLQALIDDVRAGYGDHRSRSAETATPVTARAYGHALMMCLYRSDPSLLPLVRALAVLDEQVTPAHLAELLSSTASTASWGLKAATAAGLIEDGKLRHRQAQLAVLDMMSPQERTELHARVAELLYHRGAPPLRVAQQQLAAQESAMPWSTTVLLKAAEQALEQDDTRLALDCLRLAERSGAEGFAIESMLLRAKWRLDPVVAERHLHNLYEAAQAGQLTGKEGLDLVAALQWYGRPSEAEEMLGRVNRAEQDELAAPMYSARMGLAYRYPGSTEPASGPQRTLPAQATNATKLQIQAAGIIESVFATGLTDAVVADATALLQQSRLDDDTFRPILTALDVLILAESLDTAASWCDSLLHEAQRRAIPIWLAVLSGLRAMVGFRRGELRDAERYASASLQHVPPKGLGVFIGVPLSVLILTTTRVGEDEAALSHLNMAVPEAMFQTPIGLHYLHARGRYYLTRRSYKAAIEDFEACGDLMRRWRLDLPGLVPWRTDLAEARLACGGSAADLVADQISRLGTQNGRTRGISLRILASAIELRHRPAMLREAVEHLQASGDQVELADALAGLSNAQHALGEYTDARVTGRRAQELASQCMMKVAGRPGPPDTVPAIAPLADDPTIFELSDAERRVASLAAQGCTNRQIARKLFVTVSTVEQHLTRVYRKLQINSRSDLPASLLSKVVKVV